MYSKIFDWNNLLNAFYKAARGKRLKKDVIRYEKNLYSNLKDLQKSLIEQNVMLDDYRFFKIYDPKERLICAASFNDRVLHHAIMNVAEPVFEKFQIYDSYACRKNKGTDAALLRALYFTKKYKCFLKLDMRKYFDSIAHKKLYSLLEKKIKDTHLLGLFAKIINSYSVSEERGLPIGNLTSQYFANFYLGFFDHYAKEELHAKGYVRYMDDILIFAQTLQEIKIIFQKAKFFLEKILLLTVKEENIGNVKNGVPFLGFLLKPEGIFLSQKKKMRVKKTLKKYRYMFLSGFWTEEVFTLHITPVFAHISASRCRRYCNNVLGAQDI